MAFRTLSLFEIIHGPVEHATHVPPLGPSSHNPETSTEGHAIKSMFFAIRSTYYIRFYDHIVGLVRGL